MKTLRNSNSWIAVSVRSVSRRIKRSEASFQKPSPAGYSDLAVHSASEAFLLAKYLYGGPDSPLVFTKRAEEAAEQSPFVRPVEVFRHLEHLWIFANRLRANKGALGTSWLRYFQSQGLGAYRPAISKTAAGLYENDYVTLHEGRKYLCDHHFTLGAKCANTCISIHFDTDPVTRRVLITYCGRHLSNTLS